jgi:2-oxo-4-hydroxy-4-carboxy--5-ureidoimidazoline (OHCU) decarboxylase
VRELPRQLSVDELAELFEGRTALTERLARVEEPLAHAREVARGLTPDEQVQVLDAHPQIGTRSGLSRRSAAEQGADDDPAVLAELEALNAAYEKRFGFRFVVFVNRRPRREILPILRERLDRTRDEELATGVDELVQIAIDRWQRTS